MAYPGPISLAPFQGKRPAQVGPVLLSPLATASADLAGAPIAPPWSPPASEMPTSLFTSSDEPDTDDSLTSPSIATRDSPSDPSSTALPSHQHPVTDADPGNGDETSGEPLSDTSSPDQTNEWARRLVWIMTLRCWKDCWSHCQQRWTWRRRLPKVPWIAHYSLFHTETAGMVVNHAKAPKEPKPWLLTVFYGLNTNQQLDQVRCTLSGLVSSTALHATNPTLSHVPVDLDPPIAIIGCPRHQSPRPCLPLLHKIPFQQLRLHPLLCIRRKTPHPCCRLLLLTGTSVRLPRTRLHRFYCLPMILPALLTLPRVTVT